MLPQSQAIEVLIDKIVELEQQIGTGTIETLTQVHPLEFWVPTTRRLAQLQAIWDTLQSHEQTTMDQETLRDLRHALVTIDCICQQGLAFHMGELKLDAPDLQEANKCGEVL